MFGYSLNQCLLTCQHLVRKVTSRFTCFYSSIFCLSFTSYNDIPYFPALSPFILFLLYLQLRKPRMQHSCPGPVVHESFPATSLLSWNKAADGRSEGPCSSDRARKSETKTERWLCRPAALKSTELNCCYTLPEQPSLRRHSCFSVKTIIIISDSSKILNKDLEWNRDNNRSANIKPQQWLNVV